MAKYYDKEFNQNALQYREDTPRLSVAYVFRILAIIVTTYCKWKRSAEENDNEEVHHGSGI